MDQGSRHARDHPGEGYEGSSKGIAGYVVAPIPERDGQGVNQIDLGNVIRLVYFHWVYEPRYTMEG